MRVALFNVPFASSLHMNLPLSIFKQQLSEIGIESKVFYLNNEFRRIVGTAAYEKATAWASFISSRSAWEFSPEWQKLCSDWDFNMYTKSLCENKGRVWLVVHRIREEFEKFVEEVSRRDYSDYDVFAFTARFAQVPSVFSFARHLKKNYPKAKFFFGGPCLFRHIGIEYAKKIPYIDCMYLCEAEESFVPVIQKMSQDISLEESVKDTNGVAYRDSLGNLIINQPSISKVNLDNVPVPDFSDYFDQVIENQEHEFPIYFSRGCPWAIKSPCTFCVEKELNGEVYLQRSHENAIEYLKGYVDKYPSCKYLLSGDAMLDSQFIRKVLKPWSKIRPSDLKMFVEVKPWIKKEEAKILNEAGVVRVQAGIESFNKNSLKLLSKGHKTFHSITCLKWFKLYNIEVSWNYIVPIPGERPDWYEKDLELCKNMVHFDPPLTPTEIVVSQFSEYIKKPCKWGICKTDRQYPFPRDIDSNAVSWNLDVEYTSESLYNECLISSREIRQFITSIWSGQKKAPDTDIQRIFFPPDSPTSEPRRSLRLIDEGVFDDRFNFGGEIVGITEQERKLLLKCDGPVPQHFLIQEFGQQMIDRLVEKRLLYWDEGVGVSYLESQPDVKN